MLEYSFMGTGLFAPSRRFGLHLRFSPARSTRPIELVVYISIQCTDFQFVKELLMMVHQFYKVFFHDHGNRALLSSADHSSGFENFIELVEPGRIELPTSCVQGRRSPS
jgi:hypothetical protein